MMWFDKTDNRAHFVDVRSETVELPPRKSRPNGQSVVVAPDTIADFSDLPFPDDAFALVVFDPPHFVRNTVSGWNRTLYGNLAGDWRTMLANGFAECFRVLRPDGTLIFKWAESSIPVSEILKLTPERPLFGHRSGKQAKTHWIAFLKGSANGA
jgi:SAM-dependent methyltransferase